MGLIFSPEPVIVNGSNLTINITKPVDVESYAYTTNGIPPVIAKYIAYDNLTPKNPFIATVEDGLGNILLDGGFPKWYNNACNISWSTYLDLSPSFKYLYDAIDFISNKQKVNSGNKKILILGDKDPDTHYSIKNTDPYGFKTSIDKVCSIKGFTSTYKSLQDYNGIQLNPTYPELDQYCCILFFSTAWTSDQLITDLGIQSLIAYRENGNGIFFITDHGDRVLTSIDEAINTTNSGFYRTANYIVANFGCYFSGNYNRTPVNVGFLRSNYGSHILWNNLLDSDYISAGASESKINITEYTLYTGNHSFDITQDGYHTIKVLIKYTNGSLGIASYTYGKNVPEIVFFQDKDNVNYTSSEKKTFLRKHDANISINYTENSSGILKLDLTPIGSFTFSKSLNKTDKVFNTGYSNILKILDDHMFYVQMTNPLNYTKGLRIKFDVPEFNLRTSRVLNYINDHEFKVTSTTSNFRNLTKLLCSKDNVMRQYENRFRYHRIYEYFLNINQPVEVDPITALATTTAPHPLASLFATGESFWDITFYNGKYYLCTGSGTYFSEDLQSWTKIPSTTLCFRLAAFNNYIIFPQLSGVVIMSTDGGSTFTQATYGSTHLISSLITTESGIDYLYIGTQDGYVKKINILTKALIFNIRVGSSYVDSLIEYGNMILFSGDKTIGNITKSGTLTNYNYLTFTSVVDSRFESMIRYPSGFYCFSSAGLFKSTDGINWNSYPTNITAGYDYLNYIPERGEFVLGVGNDLKYIITNDSTLNTLNNTSIVSTYKQNTFAEIRKIFWDTTYNRYLMVTRSGNLLNLVP